MTPARCARKETSIWKEDFWGSYNASRTALAHSWISGWGLGLPIDFKALSDNIRAQPFKSAFDDVDGPAEVCETAVPRGETGCFVPLGVDEVELLEQRIKIVL